MPQITCAGRAWKKNSSMFFVREQAKSKRSRLQGQRPPVQHNALPVHQPAHRRTSGSHLGDVDLKKPAFRQLHGHVHSCCRHTQNVIVGALLKATPERLIGDLNTFGFMFESLCEHDLKIYSQSSGGQLYHYQDYKNREIDAVIELPDGSWCAFEIKLGKNQVDKAVEGLITLQADIAAEGGVATSVLCVICGLTSAVYRRPDGVYVVPITALKD